MSLYSRVITTSFKTYSTHRFNFFTATLFGLGELVLKISIWQALYAARSGASLSGISLHDMIAYNIVTAFSMSFVGCRIMFEINEMVQKGEIGQRLLLPLGFRRHFFLTTVSQNIFYTIYSAIPPIIVAVLIYSFRMPLPPITVAIYVLSLCLALAINFLLQFILGLLVFWVRNAFFLDWMSGAMFSLFSGSFVPMWFFPAWLNTVGQLLPFRSIIFEPGAILLGRTVLADVPRVLLVQLIWIAILFGGGELLWRKAQRLIFAQGG
ncbi:MAG: ABC-2 family transporter protein [Bacillota bacterium]|nr:ABC-2 family transporter protein [Bacillota bacterium]